MTQLNDDLFATFERSTRDVNEACLLPPELYTSEDWFAFEIVDEPLIVVRDKRGEVRVMSAVCRHRGMVVAEGSGNCSKFRCPYHHWTYDLDGRLLGAPAMERAIDFNKSEHSLPSLPVEIWQGFVFTSFD